MFHRLLLMYVQRKYPVKEAVSTEEKQAIYKLRYDIYKSELNKSNVEAKNHQTSIIKDEEDDYVNSALFYIACPKTKEVVASFRLQRFTSNTASDRLNEQYSIDKYDVLKDKKLLDICRFMVHWRYRKSLLMLSMGSHIYNYSMSYQIDVGFLLCSPGLSRRYQIFGYRRYPASLVQSSDGVRLPMLNIVCDTDYYQQMKSPLIPLVKDYASKRGTGCLDQCRAANMLDEEGNCIEALINKASNHALLQDISSEDLRFLFSSGLIIRLEESVVVLSEGLIEKEMYIVLSGTLEVTCKSKILAELSEGDVFGEMAFFSHEGQRQATVSTKTPCTLLMLSRNFVQRLSTKNKDLSIKLLLNIAAQMGEKLSRSNRLNEV